MGELHKGSDKVFFKDADKKQVYSKRMVYLGNETLYYINKSDGKDKQISIISLKSAKLSEDRDPRDGMRLIKIDTPSSLSVVFKANDMTDFDMWYNSIYFSAANAHAKRKIEDLTTAVTKLEMENVKTDEEIVKAFFEGVDGMLTTEESRRVLFEEITNKLPANKYLGELYDMITEYKELESVQQFVKAVEIAKKIYKMVTNFDLSEFQKEDQPKVASEATGKRDILMVCMEDEYLEKDVRDLMKSLSTPETLAKIRTALELIDKQGMAISISKGINFNLFAELKLDLIQKIKEANNEKGPDSQLQSKPFDILTLPTKRYNRILQWFEPRLPQYLSVSPESENGRITAYLAKPSNTIEETKVPGRATISFSYNRSATLDLKSSSELEKLSRPFVAYDSPDKYLNNKGGKATNKMPLGV